MENQEEPQKMKEGVQRRMEHMEPPKQVLMFDAFFKLQAIFASQSVASMALHCASQSVHYACMGRNKTCQGFYFRVYEPSFVIDPSDFGKLDLIDYDRACGVTHKLNPVSSSTRMCKRYNLKGRNVK